MVANLRRSLCTLREEENFYEPKPFSTPGTFDSSAHRKLSV